MSQLIGASARFASVACPSLGETGSSSMWHRTDSGRILAGWKRPPSQPSSSPSLCSQRRQSRWPLRRNIMRNVTISASAIPTMTSCAIPLRRRRLHRNALQELLGFVPTSAAGAIEKGDLDEHAAVALAEARSMPDLFHWITARAQPDAGQELRIARSVR